MKITVTATLLPFTVSLKDERTGDLAEGQIVLDYDTVQRCESYGMDAAAIIHRMYNRQGYLVQKLTGHRKRTVTVDLANLY